MASQSSNSYLKDSYHPEEIHQLYSIATFFFTLYFISIPLFRKCFKYKPVKLLLPSLGPSPHLYCSTRVLQEFSLDLHHTLRPKSQFAGPDIQITTGTPKESQWNKPFLSIKESKRWKSKGWETLKALANIPDNLVFRWGRTLFKPLFGLNCFDPLADYCSGLSNTYVDNCLVQL